MKFVLNVFMKGKYCFFFTPLLMLALIISVKFFGVNGSTELPGWLVSSLDTRYSEDSLYLPFFIGFILSIVVSLLFDSIKFSKVERIRLGKFYDGLAYVIRNLFMFFAGWLFAWSFTSPIIEFIDPIPEQEFLIPFVLLAAVFSNYCIIKFKHFKIKG